MLSKTLVLAPVALLSLAGCTAEMKPETRVSRAPAAHVVGDSIDCIPITSMRESKVHDDYTIDFTVGSRTYRNNLPHRCGGLGTAQAFTYETSLTRLCSTDIIYVLRNIGGSYERGAGCGLGQFVPMELIKDQN
jgi:hypothetical protein